MLSLENVLVTSNEKRKRLGRGDREGLKAKAPFAFTFKPETTRAPRRWSLDSNKKRLSTFFRMGQPFLTEQNSAAILR